MSIIDTPVKLDPTGTKRVEDSSPGEFAGTAGISDKEHDERTAALVSSTSGEILKYDGHEPKWVVIDEASDHPGFWKNKE